MMCEDIHEDDAATRRSLRPAGESFKTAREYVLNASGRGQVEASKLGQLCQNLP